MDDQIKRVAVVVIAFSLICVGIAAAYVLKTYQMNAITAQTNLRLYYAADLAESHVINLNNFNWTAATGVLVNNGTVLYLWARNEGNLAGNFTFAVTYPINCTVLIAPAALMNFTVGSVAAMNLTLNNVLDNPSWQISVNY